jgi:hypothetical protein
MMARRFREHYRPFYEQAFRIVQPNFRFFPESRGGMGVPRMRPTGISPVASLAADSLQRIGDVPPSDSAKGLKFLP